MGLAGSDLAEPERPEVRQAGGTVPSRPPMLPDQRRQHGSRSPDDENF
jgi:hypothetical protein